jgi:PAS domain S-box-containing protein
VAVLFLFLAQSAADRIYRASTATLTQIRAEQIEHHATNIVAMVSRSLADPIYLSDFRAIYEISKEVLKLKGIDEIRIYDGKGLVIHDGTQAIKSYGETAPAAVLTQTIRDGKWLVQHDTANEEIPSLHQTLMAAPIMVGGKPIGAVTVWLNDHTIVQDMARYRQDFQGLIDQSRGQFLNAALSTLAFILIISIYFGVVLARRSSKPIEQLQQIATDIADGASDIEWPRERKDELGELARNLSVMVRRIRTTTVSMTYLDDIIDNIFDCLVVTDERGRIEKVNSATCKLSGFKSQELVNRDFHSLFYTPDIQTNTLASLSNLEKQAGIEEALLLTREGDKIPVQMASAVMQSHVDGRPRNVRILHDISHQKNREAELVTARQDAEAANVSKSRFLANMSHELRTPLNAIIGFSSIMKDGLKGPLSDDYRGYSKDILESAEHLLTIINDVLDISKLEAGRMELMETEILIDEIIATCMRIVRPKAGERDITFSFSHDEELPILRGDQRMVKQMVINLLSNAVKFNREGGRIDVICSRSPAGSLYLSVTDEGIGMEQDQIPKVLEPFTQADSSLNRNYEGTGLGLAITKSMIELHDGSITILSTPGKGTTVTLTFPRDRVASDNATTTGIA